MNEKLKIDYYAPTPKKWRKIGDACLAVSASLLTFLPFADGHVLQIGVIIAAMTGIVGKFITNFFTEESVNSEV